MAMSKEFKEIETSPDKVLCKITVRIKSVGLWARIYNSGLFFPRSKDMLLATMYSDS